MLSESGLLRTVKKKATAPTCSLSFHESGTASGPKGSLGEAGSGYTYPGYTCPLRVLLAALKLATAESQQTDSFRSLSELTRYATQSLSTHRLNFRLTVMRSLLCSIASGSLSSTFLQGSP